MSSASICNRENWKDWLKKNSGVQTFDWHWITDSSSTSAFISPSLSLMKSCLLFLHTFFMLFKSQHFKPKYLLSLPQACPNDLRLASLTLVPLCCSHHCYWRLAFHLCWRSACTSNQRCCPHMTTCMQISLLLLLSFVVFRRQAHVWHCARGRVDVWPKNHWSSRWSSARLWVTVSLSWFDVVVFLFRLWRESLYWLTHMFLNMCVCVFSRERNNNNFFYCYFKMNKQETSKFQKLVNLTSTSQ